MNGSVMRSAIGTAIACGAFVAGPTCVGVALSNAGVLGLGGGGDEINVVGVDVLGGGTKASGNGTAARVNSVSTAPSARSVVIRTKPAAAQTDSGTVAAAFTEPLAPAAATPGSGYSEFVPEVPPPAAPAAPAAAPMAISPPAAPAIRPPAPQGVTVPSTSAPLPGRPLAPGSSPRPAGTLPDSFRVGYAEYLRTATNTDLLVAAAPGVAGIAGFTLLGAFAGYRQAKAVQTALLAPVPTRVLL